MSGRLLNVLLVEDDIIDVTNVRRSFKKANISNPLWVAGNGIEALAMLRGGVVPRSNLIVILDLNLPMMNGIEFLTELRRDPQLAATTVVVLTTSNDDRDKIDAYRLNVSGYLLKPISFSDLVNLMSTLNQYWSLVELP